MLPRAPFASPSFQSDGDLPLAPLPRISVQPSSAPPFAVRRRKETTFAVHTEQSPPLLPLSSFSHAAFALNARVCFSLASPPPPHSLTVRRRRPLSPFPLSLFLFTSFFPRSVFPSPSSFARINFFSRVCCSVEVVYVEYGEEQEEACTILGRRRRRRRRGAVCGRRRGCPSPDRLYSSSSFLERRPSVPPLLLLLFSPIPSPPPSHLPCPVIFEEEEEESSSPPSPLLFLFYIRLSPSVRPSEAAAAASVEHVLS